VIALAWPFVALVALGVVCWTVHRLLPAKQLAQDVGRLEAEVRSTSAHVVKQDGRLRVLDEALADLRKRAESNELRKLGGAR
jgi:hypothetical protein